MQDNNRKQYFKIIFYVTIILCLCFVFYTFIWIPYKKSKSKPRTTLFTTGSSVPKNDTVGPSQDVEFDPNAQQTIPEKIVEIVKDITGPTENAYIFSARYDYFRNMDKKSTQQISDEILSLTKKTECAGDETYRGCFRKQSNHEINFNIELDKSYAYYIFPKSFGAVPYHSFADGFIVNNAHSNAWVQKIISLSDEKGNMKEYYLYAFPAYDDNNLAGPLSGFLNIISP